jgi:hypothetical protein
VGAPHLICTHQVDPSEQLFPESVRGPTSGTRDNVSESGTFTDTPLRTGTPLSPANHFRILVVSESGRTSWGPGLESASWGFICDTAAHARNGESASVEDPEKRSSLV